MEDTIGVVYACGEEQEQSFIYKWEIENYFSLPPLEEDIHFRSPPFVFSGETYCLAVCPFLATVGDLVGRVNIDLIKMQPRNENENHYVKCDLGIQHSNIEEYDFFELEMSLGEDKLNGEGDNFIDEEELFKRSWFKTISRSFGVSDDRIIIFCNFRVVAFIDVEQQEPKISRFPRSFSSNKQKIMNTLCQNMENMYLDQKDCDVILVVCGQEFRAHKAILRARCVVFTNMFECEMAENLNGIVNIHDVDPNVFKNILIYVYSGEIRELSSDSVFEYYKQADKFQLAELREACLEFMEYNISSANVFNFIQLSDKHGDKKLEDIAKQFLAENLEEVMSTEGWAMLKIHNPPITVEILEMSNALQKIPTSSEASLQKEGLMTSFIQYLHRVFFSRFYSNK